MANTKSINKILNFLKENDNRAFSITDICLSVNLKWKAVIECLEFLKHTNQITILSTGKTTLIQFNSLKQNCEVIK